jgi:hypothetical protein
MLRHRAILLMSISLAACATQPAPAASDAVSPVIQIDLGREAEIAVSQEAHVRGTPITMKFRGVTQDSRCPSDVRCVWAGNAVARFTLSSGEGPSVEATMNTGLDPKSVVFSGYRISLVGLRPAPVSGSTIPPGSYVATVEAAPAS